MASPMRPQATEGEFPTAVEGLPEAQPSARVELADGDEVTLDIAPVAKDIGGTVVRMLAYNGSVPGPTLVAPENGTITVHVTNRGDLDATVHWHGLRLENRYDGTHETQAPIPVGESFTYEVHLPDPGVYWYHPHIREDYGQEMGLYGNILVVPDRSRLLAAGRSRSPPHPRRRAHRGRQDRDVQSLRDELRSHGSLRQRHARLRGG